MGKRSQLKVTFSIAGGFQRTANGKEALTLIALKNAGPRGITSLETFKAGWAVRLGAYIFDLKKMGVPIVTTREPHDGGNHGRYTLTGEIMLHSVIGAEPEQQTLRAVA